MAQTQTYANYAAIVKEAWSSDEVQFQLYSENEILRRIQQVQGDQLGTQVSTPIKKSYGGGFTTTSAAGGALNPANASTPDKAVWTLVYSWFQAAIEAGAMNQSASSATAAMRAANYEMEDALAKSSKEFSRQILGNADGQIAQCTTTSASTTVNLLNTGYGYDAIQRGWLHPGQQISIGTASDADFRTNALTGGFATIVSVVESASAPQLIVDQAVTTASTDYISNKNPNSTSLFAPELNGFRSMFGSTTSVIGGINPAAAGNGYWTPALVDTATTVFSLDLVLSMQKAVHQKSSAELTLVLGAKQEAALYSLLQNQVRFNGDGGLSAGKTGGMAWNTTPVMSVPDVPDREVYLVSFDNLVRAVGEIEKPVWASDYFGGNSGGFSQWIPDTTRGQDALIWPMNIGTKQRNANSAALGLTA